MKYFILSFLAVGSLALSSCNTMIGLGRDFRQIGEGLENSGNGRSWKSSSADQGY